MNKVMISLIGASALALSTAGLAATTTIASAKSTVNDPTGFYVSGNVGYGAVDLKAPDVPGLKTTKDGFTWMANLGYQFNRYIAVEGGYLQLANVKVKDEDSNVSGTAKTAGYDLLAKGIYPINDKFDVFGKAGIALLSHKGIIADNTNTTFVINDTKHKVVPMFGLGVDYNLTQNWALSLQGITTLKSGNNFPATYTWLVGVTYKFG